MLVDMCMCVSVEKQNVSQAGLWAGTWWHWTPTSPTEKIRATLYLATQTLILRSFQAADLSLKSSSTSFLSQLISVCHRGITRTAHQQVETIWDWILLTLILWIRFMFSSCSCSSRSLTLVGTYLCVYVCVFGWLTVQCFPEVKLCGFYC